MYDKQNANYGLYLAGMITEHQYYDLCEGKKAKKKVKAQDVNGDGKIDFIDVLASRMMASGMSKEEAIKKASAHAKKHNKKGMKKGMKDCMKMENIGMSQLAKSIGVKTGNVANALSPLFSALIQFAKQDKSKFMTMLKKIDMDLPEHLDFTSIKRAISLIKPEELDEPEEQPK